MPHAKLGSITVLQCVEISCESEVRQNEGNIQKAGKCEGVGSQLRISLYLRAFVAEVK